MQLAPAIAGGSLARHAGKSVTRNTNKMPAAAPSSNKPINSKPVMGITVIKERPFAGRLRTLPIDWLSGQSVSIGEMIDAEDDLPPRVPERCVARSTVRSCRRRDVG
jgi:hypothetical protein